MTPGQQACQAVHAAFDFSQAYPVETAEWHTTSNHVCLLEVEDQIVLQKLLYEFRSAGHRAVVVVEPDLGNEATAVAVDPTAKALVRRLKLAFK